MTFAVTREVNVEVRLSGKVRRALDIDHLLELRSRFHGGVHGFDLQLERVGQLGVQCDIGLEIL